MFAGTFPYSVLPADDPRQASAIADFMKNESAFGNMYPVGDTVCVWYAAWMGIAFARLGELEKTRHYIDLAVAETNRFSEIFEISTPAHHPWFTTGAGAYVQMVNESLLQSSEGRIRILPNRDEEYAFRLAATGGVTVDVEVIGGQLRKVLLSARRPYAGTLVLPNGDELPVDLQAGEERTFA